MALGALLLPGVAAAQAPAPYVVQRQSATYQALSSAATAVSASGDDSYTSVTLPFPVQIFGNTYNTFYPSTNGLAAFVSGTTSYSNNAIPSTSTPNGMIAAWWDDNYCDSGAIKTETIGTAPTRQFAIQWHCRSLSYSSFTWQAQLWITEGSTTIKIHYGAAGTGSPTATVGLEDATGVYGYNALSNCTSSCGANDWPTNTIVTYAQGPDVVVTGMTADSIGYAGVDMHMEAIGTNSGGEDALGFGMSFYVSADQYLDATDSYLGDAPTTGDATPGNSVTFSLDAPLPVTLSPGWYYLLAEVDPLDAVNEDNENNNVGFYGPFEVGIPAPDIVVESIALPVDAQPGASFTLEWVARNFGNDRGVDVPYHVVLSTNDVISLTDTRIHEGVFSIDMLTAETILAEVALGSQIRTGDYWLGILLDPNDVVYELDERNNVGVTTETFLVGDSDLSVTTISLPDAAIGAEYCVGLEATGGNGTFTWTVIDGALPQGLELTELPANAREAGEPFATLLCGVPATLGDASFTLQVESAGMMAAQSYTLTVNDNSVPLVVDTSELPVAAFQVDYEASLLAVGGRPPYSWKILHGDLPLGLALDMHGNFVGAPRVDGPFELTVEVTDSQDNRAERLVTLNVASPARLTCVTDELPSIKVGQSIENQLLAAGGSKPYTWQTVETRRLANGSTDSGDSFIELPPPGLVLSGAGKVTGAPAAAGRYVWIVKVVDTTTLSNDTCAVTMDVQFDQGITVVTTQLGDAYANRAYTAQLVATGAAGFVNWTLAEGSYLPEGLSLTPEGIIEGTLLADLLEGETTKTWSFIVQVVDSQNRRGLAPLSITLREEPKTEVVEDEPKEEGGCQAGAADPSLLALGVALGLAAFRRRR